MTQARWRQAKAGRDLARTLVACLIIFGLINIPVECAVATGPHSMFLSAVSVAELQHAAGHHTATADAPAHRSAAHTTNSMRHGSEERALTTAGMAEMQDSASDDALPTPAGFANNAVPLRATSGPKQGARLGGVSLPISTYVSEPSGHLLAGPEPPPPNLAWRVM